MISGKTSLFVSPEELGTLLKKGVVSITVLGLGRIGLPTAVAFSRAGAKVYGVDISKPVVESVSRGESRFVDEPGLADALLEVSSNGRLEATLDAESSIRKSDFVIVSVPTPVLQNKTPDYTAVRAASLTIGKSLRSGTTVIIESTVGPGTVEELVAPVIESESGMKSGVDFGLASCPERSDPGNIMNNLKSVPRVVGAENPRTRDVVAALYQNALGADVVKVSSPKTANAVKLTENLFRDVNIALANEFALLYEKLGIDVIEVIEACATKYNFMPHYPGPGVGGPCLPSNPYYLIEEGQRVGNIPYLVRLAREINDRMPDHVVELVAEALNEVSKTVKGSRIAVLGIAYKANVKDVQLSPLEPICKKLSQMGAIVKLYDPMFAGEYAMGYPVSNSIESAARDADCVVVGTAHNEFKRIDLSELRTIVSHNPGLVDTRNLFDPVAAREAGFAYVGVGRPRSKLAGIS